jgi:trans-AT polyketide synthase/acyltransferase/oxidoreductase domain-containing protein
MPAFTLHASQSPAFDPRAIAAACADPRSTAHVVQEGGARAGVHGGRIGVALEGELLQGGPGYPVLATLPPLYPEWLGDRSFAEVHDVRFPYVVGEMANGITTARMVVAMARAGMLGFFGAGGLMPDRVEKALDEIQAELSGTGLPYGVNLIHSPQEPAIENAVSEMLLRRGVARCCASAFMSITPAVVRYAVAGLRRAPDGRIERTTHLFGKVSRTELAEMFFSPAPAAIVEQLLRAGQLTADQAELAKHVPLAEDVTVEADSGGHTDNRALPVVLPLVLAVRDRLARRFEYASRLRVGAAGGLGVPSGVAGAFAMGADYVLTGSVNQSAVESGLSEAGRLLLAQAGMADVMMAPAADMFEMGVKLQVLKRGTMFGQRATRLWELYRDHESLEQIPAAARQKLEREIFAMSIDEVWATTRDYFLGRAPEEIAKAERDPKHKMALVFRWYLGRSSRWAIEGDPKRKLDYQIWCGPAMGAFNDWVKGSFLERPEARTVAQIALNLLEGAAVITRAQQLRTYGVPVPPEAFHFVPRPLA